MSALDVAVSAALGGAAALAATLSASALPGLRLATRRAFVVVGLLVAALAPVVALLATSLGVGLRPAPAAGTDEARVARPVAPRAVAGTNPGVPRATESSVPPVPAASGPRPPRPLPWPALLSIVWLGGTAIGLVRVGVGLARLRSLRRTMRVPGDPRLAGLRVSDALSAPATVGILAPVVGIPAPLALGLADDEIDAIRRHEGSHVARRDPLAGFSARLVRALHWPDPLAHVASRRLDALCEALADAEAVGPRPAEARCYAACLVRIAERVVAARASAGVHGVVGGRRALTRRVEALLGARVPRDPRSTGWGRAAAAGTAALSIVLAACCCRAPARAPAPAPSRAPAVVGFSPRAMSEDPITGGAGLTFTDGDLRVNTDPAYPGRIVVFFRRGTPLDPRTVFLHGDPALGVDLSALQVLQFIPGTGNVPVAPAPGGPLVLPDRILFTPARLPLPEGQYSVAVFSGVRDVEGRPSDPAPVFHGFVVGSSDTIAPTVVVTNPVSGARDVGAGVAPGTGGAGPAVAGVRLEGGSADVVVRFTEPMAARSVTREAIRVVDAGALVPPGGQAPRLVPAPGYPRLHRPTEDGSGGFEVVWRPDPATGGFPFGTRIRVTVVGSDGGANAQALTDLAGNPLPRSYTFEFATVAPPTLPAGR